MERKRKIIASLADLKQDIAGPIPVDIISKWQKSAKNERAHQEILRPYEKRGYLVSSDSSGLSRLASERDLIEVMNIVSQPKEIIYSHGIKVGGRGVGVWFADNTEMFYDENIPAEVVLEQMAAAQKRIHQQLLQVGMAIHKGVFWEIHGGMFGEEASLLEQAAENYTEPKEIIISESVRNVLPKKVGYNLALREDLNFSQKFYSVNYDDLGHGATYHLDFCYPIPFSMEFYKAMKHYGISEEAHQIINKHFQEKIVILVKIKHKKFKLLLDELTDWIVVNASLNELVNKHGVMQIKSNGDLGLFISTEVGAALDFAEEVIKVFSKDEDKVNVGIAAGEIMIFNLDNGSHDLAGGPVNIASKISEDIEAKNSLYVHETVVIPRSMEKKFKAFTMEKSGIIIRGKRLI